MVAAGPFYRHRRGFVADPPIHRATTLTSTYDPIFHVSMGGVMDDDSVWVPRTEWERVLGRLDSLERRCKVYESAATVAPPDRPAQPAPTVKGGPLSRRKAIVGLAGAAVGAVAATAIAAEPAAATAGDPMLLGSFNNSAISTFLTNATAGQHGMKIADNGTQGQQVAKSALWLDVESVMENGLLVTSAVPKGMKVTVTSTSVDTVAADHSFVNGIGIKVLGQSGTSLVSSSVTGTAIAAQASNGIAAVLSGQAAQLYLDSPAARPAPLGDAIFHSRGELVRDTAGDLWLCTVSGTPGAFRKLGGPSTAGALHVLPAPARIYDSRPGTQPTAIGPKTPLNFNSARVLDTTVNNSNVPQGATAAIITVLLVNAAQANGNFTMWANGVARPSANTMVWGAGSGRYTTLALTALDATGKIQVAASSQTDIVLDVVGYYR